MVEVHVPAADGVLLLDPQYLLKAHDRLHGDESRPREGRREQRVRQRPLFAVHVPVCDAVAAVPASGDEVVVGHEVPSLVVRVVQLVLGGGDLVAVQGRQPGLGRTHHQVFRRGVIRHGSENQSEGQQDSATGVGTMHGKLLRDDGRPR